MKSEIRNLKSPSGDLSLSGCVGARMVLHPQRVDSKVSSRIILHPLFRRSAASEVPLAVRKGHTLILPWGTVEV